MKPVPSTLDAAQHAALAQAAAAWQHQRFDAVLSALAPWLGAPQPAPAALQLAGLAQQRLGRLDEARQLQQRLVQQTPADVAAWVNLAATEAALGLHAQALQHLERALQLDAAQPAIHFNRGHVLMQMGDAAAALESFRRAGDLAPERPDPVCNQAAALNQLGRHDEALALMQGVVQRYPELAAGWNLLGMCQHRLGQDALALASYQRALQLAPTLADAWSNAAQVLARLQRHAEAIEHAERAVQLDPRHAVAARTLGVVLAGAKRHAEARPWLARAQQLDPQDTVASSNLLAADQALCDWDAVDADLAALRTQWRQGRLEGVEPWYLLALPVDGAELRQVTEAVSALRFPLGPEGDAAAPRWRALVGQPRPERLRVGYFSSDFHQHATSVLMAGLFEQHDRTRFEWVGICLGRYPAGQDDPMRQRVRAAFDRFEAWGELSDAELVQRARALDLHLAVDLKGHTADSRMGVFAQRVAPIQLHHIGYPGTLGMPGAIDYQVADAIVVPPEAYPHYSEKIIALPDSYQVNDRARAIDPQVPTRASQGLPSGAFVFCCFNHHYKITREVFGLWMELLRQRPASVLWLLVPEGDARRNLRAAAAAHGVDAQRLVFAGRAPLPQHLARHACADLFLDTWPYNAHTTASDALWAGLPVLTCAGASFAARVGASLLQACGLPDLVTHDARAYVDQALQLSAEPERVQAFKRQLAQTRLAVPLFDTARFARHLERAFDLAWERHAQGLPPDHIRVPALP
ncbi:MAG: tetratricopeptide repeat protein [Burkholderiaceae bacterium]|nr:tetratricopeptide repeat protein [Pseudomonadota bacterium]MBS0596496.1 tetratricopeptide repeat protein [Pseudomonadota bacterium]MCO5116569.1 tetratricopeptide repeat protein [Burkholderiaceae bacterium]MCP5219230.1 tetratricopeptide repeat protein [Burkholderiaceae bacterium]